MLTGVGWHTSDRKSITSSSVLTQGSWPHKVIYVTSVICFVVRQQTDKSSVVCIIEVVIVWVCTSAWISVQTWLQYTPLRSSGGDGYMWRTHTTDIHILWAVGKETSMTNCLPTPRSISFLIIKCGWIVLNADEKSTPGLDTNQWRSSTWTHRSPE